MAKKPRIDYQPNTRGTGTLLRTSEMAAVVTGAAEKAKAYAEQISPRCTGRYAASFRVETTRRGGPRRDRVEARLINDTSYAWAVEFVNHNGRVLGRVVDFIERTEP